jgi:hypothetical protein
MNTTHYMTATGVYVMLLLGFVIDYWSIGPNSIRDRLAFLIYLACFREGFNGSEIDRALVELFGGVIDKTKDWARDAYIADADTRIVIGASVSVIAIYCVGCLLPDVWAQHMGRYAAMAFTVRSRSRINWRLLSCAIVIGLMVDLSKGMLGGLFNMLVQLDVELISELPDILFGTGEGGYGQ